MGRRLRAARARRLSLSVYWRVGRAGRRPASDMGDRGGVAARGGAAGGDLPGPRAEDAAWQTHAALSPPDDPPPFERAFGRGISRRQYQTEVCTFTIGLATFDV